MSTIIADRLEIPGLLADEQAELNVLWSQLRRRRPRNQLRQCLGTMNHKV